MIQSSWLGLIRPSASTRPGQDGWGGGGVSDDGVKVRR
jgi:hypothetical protein